MYVLSSFVHLNSVVLISCVWWSLWDKDEIKFVRQKTTRLSREKDDLTFLRQKTTCPLRDEDDLTFVRQKTTFWGKRRTDLCAHQKVRRLGKEAKISGDTSSWDERKETRNNYKYLSIQASCRLMIIDSLDNVDAITVTFIPINKRSRLFNCLHLNSSLLPFHIRDVINSPVIVTACHSSILRPGGQNLPAFVINSHFTVHTSTITLCI